MHRLFETQLAFEVKSYDVDYVGSVHNVVYVRWAERLRLPMLAPHYPLERFDLFQPRKSCSSHFITTIVWLSE